MLYNNIRLLQARQDPIGKTGAKDDPSPGIPEGRSQDQNPSVGFHIRGQLQKIKELNQELISKSENIVTSLNKIVVLKTNKCTVCYTRERRVVFQPCGHVFCESCADRATTRNRCFTCRASVVSSFRIYL